MFGALPAKDIGIQGVFPALVVGCLENLFQSWFAMMNSTVT
jgi:hypothetical protein